MKRKIFVFIFLVIFVLITFFFISGLGYDEAVSVKEFNRSGGERTQRNSFVIGKLSTISFDFFTIADLEFPEEKIEYMFEKNELSLSNYAVGDAVLVESSYDKERQSMKASNIETVNLNRALRHLEARKPLLKPGKTSELSNDTFMITLENIGIKTIKYEDLYDENFGYSLIYKLNDELYLFHPIEDFVKIEPGDLIEVEFPISVNMLSEMRKGENVITFIWAQKSLYDNNFKSILESEPIEVILEDSI